MNNMNFIYFLKLFENLQYYLSKYNHINNYNEKEKKIYKNVYNRTNSEKTNRKNIVTITNYFI